MTKKELKSKISEVMNEAIKIDEIDKIAKDMDRIMDRADLTETTKDALMIGYTNMLGKAYKKIQFIWLHLHDVRSAVDDLDDHFLDLPTGEEIDEVREVMGDD